jgi:hypothetical protein
MGGLLELGRLVEVVVGEAALLCSGGGWHLHTPVLLGGKPPLGH